MMGIKWVYYVFIVLLCALIPLESRANMKEKENKFLMVYYMPFRIQTAVPVTKKNIEQRCLAEILVGNKTLVKQIRKIISESIEKKGEFVEDTENIRVKMVFFNIGGKKDVLFIGKNRNFEFNKIKGRISQEYLDKLEYILEHSQEIVDLKYFSEIKKKKELPSCQDAK